jgi:hypothetical protein
MPKHTRKFDSDTTNKHSCPWKTSFSKLSIAGTAIATMALIGCGKDSSIEAVAKFSERIKPQIDATAPVLINDINGSCARTQIIQLPAGEELFTKDKSTGKTVFLFDQNIKTHCSSNEIREATAAFESAHAIISNYILIIGKLAGSDIASYDSEVSSLVPAIAGLPFVSDKETKDAVEAGGSIAKILTRIIAQGYQKAQLRSAISSADLPLKIMAKNYSIAIDQYYKNGLLETELLAVNAFYGLPLRSARRISTSPFLIGINPFIVTSLTGTLATEREAVMKRKAFASTYIKLIREISCDHTTLNELLQGGSISNVASKNELCEQSAMEAVTIKSRHPTQELVANEYLKHIILKYDRLLTELNNARITIERQSSSL